MTLFDGVVPLTEAFVRLPWGSLPVEMMPFTATESPRGSSCPCRFVCERPSVSTTRKGVSAELLSSRERTGVRVLPVADAASKFGVIFEESPLRNGIIDVRFFSFFVFSADEDCSWVAFFLLPITVPRRLFSPGLLGVSTASK